MILMYLSVRLHDCPSEFVQIRHGIVRFLTLIQYIGDNSCRHLIFVLINNLLNGAHLVHFFLFWPEIFAK